MYTNLYSPKNLTFNSNFDYFINFLLLIVYIFSRFSLEKVLNKAKVLVKQKRVFVHFFKTVEAILFYYKNFVLTQNIVRL